MMLEILPIIAVLGLFFIGLWLISRKQMNDYKGYLASHTEETAHQTANQREMIDAQVAAIDRQTLVLKRIAKALQDRPDR
ncbi:MAG: hypothetical protein AAF311_15430 [Pseudomonadota bacterium]